MNTTSSNARLKASLEELARFGCPVDLSVAVTAIENEKVEIEQVGGIYESHIFQLQDSRVACMAYIAVTNQTARTIDVLDVELRAPWSDGRFEWLTPLQVNSPGRAKRGPSRSVYQFPQEAELQFEYGEVINHRLVDRGKLVGTRRLEGWLLGIGGPMPAEIRHGQWLDLSLAIIGSDHAEHSTIIQLPTVRLRARTKFIKTRTSIFAKLVEEEPRLAQDVTRPAPLPASQSPAF